MSFYERKAQEQLSESKELKLNGKTKEAAQALFEYETYLMMIKQGES